jgi:hypothetical protein
MQNSAVKFEEGEELKIKLGWNQTNELFMRNI